MATFTLRPKVDTPRSDNWTYTIKSDAGKYYWEHIFAADDDIYLYSANDSNTIGTQCAILENDIPSISSADGKLTNITCYARGKVVGAGTFQLTAIVGAYGADTDITEGDGYVTATYECTQYDDLENDLWELEMGGYVGGLQNGVKTFDYVYCIVTYTPAVPTMHSQTIEALDEGELASLYARARYYTWIKEWGFEVRLKETQALVKKVTWTGTRLPMVAWTTELGLSDGLEFGTTYEGRGYCITDDGTCNGTWVEFTTRVAPYAITTDAASEIAWQCAMGNGTIDAGEPTERGFEIRLDFGEYKDSNSGTLANYIDHSIAGFEGDVTWDIVYKWNGILTKTETETGTFSTGAYELVLGYPSVLGNPSSVFNDKLFKCESYTYRAYMIIDDTIYRGSYVAFDTLCAGAPIADDISDGNPTEPIIPIVPIEWELPEFIWELPDWELPDLPPWIYPDLPDWAFPDFPPMNWTGDFYYRRPYTKKDLDDLRKKCIIYSKNSVEFAMVLRHNMNVLREFFNMMTDYMSKEEFNDFTDLIPPQRLKELYLDPLDPVDFRDMINEFIRNTIDNNIAVNRNFKLIQDGLSEYETESDDAYFKEINSNIKTVTEDDPDVHRLKRKIDSLNQEVSMNFSNIMYNLKVLRARLL